MALYSTHRPKTFSNMVGQESLRKTLLHASFSKKISHAYLFCGTRGTGKTTSARILAKAINCTNLSDKGDPCGTCSLCTLAEKGTLTDIIEIDAASNRGIDEIRDLREKVSFSPNMASSKIYIIDEVHMLTKEAFNALLKTLEEPPSHAYFILATTEFHKVPETIRSRCQTFLFKNISNSDIVRRLEYICELENIKYTKDGLEMIASRSSGGLRDAISLLEQSAHFGIISADVLQDNLGIINDSILKDFFESLHGSDAIQSFSFLESILSEGRSLDEFGKNFLGYLKQMFHLYIQEKNILLPWIIEVIEIFQESLEKSKRYEIPSLAFEIAIAKIYLKNKEFKDSLQSFKESSSVLEENTPLYSQKTVKSDTKKREEVNEKKIKNDLKNDIDELLPPWEERKDSTLNSTVKNKNFSQNSFEEEQKEEEKKDLISSSSVDFFSQVVSQWKESLTSLPTGLRLNMIKYATPQKFSDGLLTVSLSSNSVRSLIEKTENIQKISDVLSQFFKKTVVLKVQTEVTSEDVLSVEKVESLLRF